jgi:hypothetical protein
MDAFPACWCCVQATREEAYLERAKELYWQVTPPYY